MRLEQRQEKPLAEVQDNGRRWCEQCRSKRATYIGTAGLRCKICSGLVQAFTRRKPTDLHPLYEGALRELAAMVEEG